jgi:hypothetical protein
MLTTPFYRTDASLPLPMYLPIWKAKTSMSLLIDKREKR